MLKDHKNKKDPISIKKFLQFLVKI